jgi:hypothetical protein
MDRGGFSEIVSTMILTSAILVIVIIAMSSALTAVRVQVDLSEFEHVKTALTMFSQVIEDVASKPGSAGFVRFNIQSGRLNIVQNGTLTVTVTDGVYTWSSVKPIYVVYYDAGPNISTTSEDLRGGWNLIVRDLSQPIAHVYTVQRGGVKAILDFRRVKAVNLGTLTYRNVDGGLGVLGVIELTAITLSYGGIRGAEKLNLKAQNENVSVIQLPQLLKGSVTVTVEADGFSESMLFTFSGVDGVMVNIVEASVKVFTV